MDECMHLNLQCHSTHTYVCNCLSPSGFNNPQIPLHRVRTSACARLGVIAGKADYLTAIWNDINFYEAERRFVEAVKPA
ncbi:hypothetical protein L226DRAFT_540942, partial [Lentinus tigrinus ALCF2SS1-7]|uniref:uncharacterized protein n=1 Tax=Lentinus tigrinus ALCF2SS1-7 TaxID=1328758 RepID=UPI00116618EB